LEDFLTVLGGGPVGCYTAIQALKLGVHVKVFEEHRSPGGPEHCTGHVSVNGLNRIGLSIPDSIIQQRVSGYRFYSPSGQSLTFKFKQPQTLIIDRRRFDKWLAETVIKMGGEYLPHTRVTKIEYASHRKWKISYRDEKGLRREELSPITIDAEGFPPNLLHRSGILNQSRLGFIYGFQAWLKNVENGGEGVVEVYLTRRFSPGFYGWIAPLSDGSGKSGLGSIFPNVKSMFNEFKTHHPTASDKLRKAEISRFQSHLIPLTGPIKKTCYRGLTVVGDAASQVKQTTGGGLITGLNAARLAGEAAAQALIKGDPNATSHYESRFQKLYGADFKFMGFLRRILNMFSDDALNRAFKAISSSSMEFKLNDDIDLDHQMKLIFEALKNPSRVRKAFSLIAILASTWIRGV